MNLCDAIDKIRPCIVQISFMARGLSPEFQSKLKKPIFHHVLGTGFFVDSNGHVLTAKHVIDGCKKLGEKIPANDKRILVGLAIPNSTNIRANFNYVDCTVIDEDEHHDIALLKLAKNPFKGEVRSGFVIGGKELPLLYGLSALNSKRPRDGTPIAISGYPLNETVLVSNSGGLASSWGTEIKDIQVIETPYAFTIPHISDVYLADIEINQGDSGAPVYALEDATVIGLCVANKPAPVRDQYGDNVYVDGKHYFYSSGLTIVVPVTYITELLNKNKIEFNST